ncbi:VirD4-like conjugal transfer protein, CD1115 family [Priestia megaterium]|uniref:VirD4-like conjugal transfer protein, CD1115 family n=1 Tax=Priestia megaterium TaxID=1404 RepID=UPI002795CA05|nr:type IV secretory system conjugative DNA transfer family protein [Priestia megaterium]
MQGLRYKFASMKVLLPVSTFLFLFIFLLLNFILNTLMDVIKTTFSDVLDPQPLKFEASYIYTFHFEKYSYAYAAMAILALIAVGKFIYNVRSNFSNLNQNQKGSSRFTTEKELKQQYKAVPEKDDRYKGGGGVVISRLKDKIFVDDSPVNNLIIGTTRSGKGETFVFPTIDVYSRAEHQPSLILNDPKGELLAASKETLEKRGYHIEVLNLLNPLESMSYNLLQLVKDAYKDGDYSTAQTLCNTLTHSLYYNPNAKDPMWQNSAMSLVNAMILAVTDKCIKEGTEEKITMYTVANMLSELGTSEALDDEGVPQNALDMYFQSLPSHSVARMQYATSNFAKGNTRAGIFTQTMSELTIFTFDEIAKMTSRNSVDLKRVGFGKSIKGVASPLKRLVINFPDGSEDSVKTNKDGLFDVNFKGEIKEGEEIVLFEKDNPDDKTVVEVISIDKDSGKTKLEVVAQNEDIVVKELSCFEKPIAIFMVTPDYDSSNHVIASIFVRQLYFILAKNASLAKGNKCHREVVFLLDEFGNMPSIEGMANIITVCLGRNIRFNLIIQAYAQLKNKYADDAPTIDGNCGNTIYILTNDSDTAEKISKKLDKKTINSTSRSGKGLSFDKSKTESVDGRSLLTANELMRLKEGESVVIRVIKRQDNERNRIEAFPIFNTGRTTLKYRWEYLNKEFDTDKSILDIDIKSEHAEVDPHKLVINFFDDEEEYEEEKSVEAKQEVRQEEKKEAQQKIHQEKVEKPVDSIAEKKAVDDNPFSELTIDNWKEKTVEDFFSTDKAMLRIIEQHFLGELNRTMDEVKACPMSEFKESLDILASNEQITSQIYTAVNGKINKIVYDLKKKKEELAI